MSKSIVWVPGQTYEWNTTESSGRKPYLLIFFEVGEAEDGLFSKWLLIWDICSLYLKKKKESLCTNTPQHPSLNHTQIYLQIVQEVKRKGNIPFLFKWTGTTRHTQNQVMGCLYYAGSSELKHYLNSPRHYSGTWSSSGDVAWLEPDWLPHQGSFLVPY